MELVCGSLIGHFMVRFCQRNDVLYDEFWIKSLSPVRNTNSTHTENTIVVSDQSSDGLTVLLFVLLLIHLVKRSIA